MAALSDRAVNVTPSERSQWVHPMQHRLFYQNRNLVHLVKPTAHGAAIEDTAASVGTKRQSWQRDRHMITKSALAH